jgi:hypothetical protein
MDGLEGIAMDNDKSYRDIIYILTPGGAPTLHSATSRELMTAHLLREGYQINMNHIYMPIVHHARNVLLANGQPLRNTTRPIGSRYDKILFLETDMVFAPEDIERLLMADADIVSGLYPMGPDHPDIAIAGSYTKDGQEQRLSISAIQKQEGPELFEVDFCGLGIIAIRYGVFESMVCPWFGNDTLYEYGIDMSTVKLIGDDFGFCRKAKENGFKVHVHRGVRAGHEKNIIV